MFLYSASSMCLLSHFLSAMTDLKKRKEKYQSFHLQWKWKGIFHNMKFALTSKRSNFLFFLPLRYDLGKQRLVASYLTCFVIKLGLCLFQWCFLWSLVFCWNRENSKLKNVILFKQHEKLLWSTISLLLICQKKLNDIHPWNILFCTGEVVKETVKVIWFGVCN